ncbi:MAG: hypothetical protein RIQ99_965 [Pseudomonadota bacterium]|jgi:hypothetical protein
MAGIDGDRDQQLDGAWDDHADPDDRGPLETEQLALAREERLPWLESSDDDDADTGSATARLLALMLAGLVLLGVIVGGIWWATHRGGDAEMVADGSTITAPKTPYKEAPRDPGGKTFAGTGDSSFAVSAGQNRPAQLGGQPDGAAPPLPAAAVPAAVPAGKAPVAGAVAAPKVGGVGVQVGAFSSQTTAEAAWAKLVSQSNGLLSGVSHRVVEGNADIGKVYRLQAVAGDAAGANTLCGRLKAGGIACQVK